MKNTLKHIGYALWVIGLLLVTVPAMAQQQTWKSTSSLKTSGSIYTPQVTPVGAVVPMSQSSVGGDPYTPAGIGGPRKVLPGGTIEPDQSSDSPIGDGLIPLSLMALIYALVMYFRRRKEERKKTL